MDGQKNTHLNFLCVAGELSLEHTPLSVLLMNCLHIQRVEDELSPE